MLFVVWDHHVCFSVVGCEFYGMVNKGVPGNVLSAWLSSCLPDCADCARGTGGRVMAGVE